MQCIGVYTLIDAEIGKKFMTKEQSLDRYAWTIVMQLNISFKWSQCSLGTIQRSEVSEYQVVHEVICSIYHRALTPITKQHLMKLSVWLILLGSCDNSPDLIQNKTVQGNKVCTSGNRVFERQCERSKAMTLATLKQWNLSILSPFQQKIISALIQA